MLANIEMIKRIFIGLILLSLSIQSYGQTLSMQKFTYSSCLDTLRDSHSAINYQQGENNTTIIYLRTYAPCRGDFKGGVKMLSTNQVNLTFSLKPTVIKKRNGQLDSMLEVAECNCLYDFTYQISGLQDITSKAVLVNKQSLKQIDDRNILSKEEVELDKEIKEK